MRKKHIKTYEQYAVDYELSTAFSQTQLTSDEISDSQKRTYERRFVNHLLMMDVVEEEDLNENLIIDEVIDAISMSDFETDSKKFYESFKKSKRLIFLTAYTIKDMDNFRTYKLRGYDIGFAIKNNGDIILVHNNEPNVKGVGDLMIKKAIELGGDHLDHFDGYLTGYYKRNGFFLTKNDTFNDEYAPEKWDYKKVDIYDKNESIYVNELRVDIKDFENAETRYENGKPDVIYRKIIN